MADFSAPETSVTGEAATVVAVATPEDFEVSIGTFTPACVFSPRASVTVTTVGLVATTAVVAFCCAAAALAPRVETAPPMAAA